MLFSREIEALHDDGFEGSTSELLTSRKVYFGNDGGRGSKRCLVTGVINFERNFNKDTDVSPCSNSGNSDLTSQEDTCGVKESGHVHLSEDFEMRMRNVPVEKVKRMKISVDNLMDSSAPLFKGVVSGVSQRRPSCVSQTVTCRLVESTSQGVLCSCYLLKKNIEMDLGGDADSRDISKPDRPSLEGSEQKETGASKAVASPVSQESTATKLLAASPSAIVAVDSGCPRIPKQRWKESCFLELDESEMSFYRESKNSPRPLLRYHVNRLLKAAGWAVGRRKRSKTYHSHGEFVYRSPEGRPFREFRRAWILCGQNLLNDSKSSFQGSDDKQWTDLTQFLSDLSDTSAKISELSNLETTAALVHCWCLLDPFANLVFIDKKFNSLKAGKVVKAKSSLMSNTSRNSDDVLASENVENARNTLAAKHVIDRPSRSYVVSDSALTLFNEDTVIQQNQAGGGHFWNSEHLQAVPVKAEKDNPSDLIENNCLSSFNKVGETDIMYMKISSKERSSVDPFSLQVYESDSNSDKNGLFEVPINTEDANLYGRCGTASPDEGSNICSQSSEREKADEKRVTKSNKNSEINPEGFISSARVDRVLNNSSLWYAQQQNEIRHSNSKNFHLISGSGKKLIHANYDNKLPDQHSFGLSTGGGGLPVKSESIRSGVKSKKPMARNGNGKKSSLKCHPGDDDLLISAIMKTKSFKPTKRSSVKRVPCKSKPFKKHKKKKNSCKLLPRSFNRGGGMCYMEGKWSALGSRTVLSWLIHSGVVSVNEVIQYRNTKDDAVVKDGLVTWDGILCRCCDQVLSVSEFKRHAGFRLNRPCMNLFMESGKPLTLCQLEAWSAEYKARKGATRPILVEDIDENDDSCGLCGGGGELICCDNCPSTFHQACLFAQELPEGSWYCSHCTCEICGLVVIDKEDSNSPGALKCLQCDHKYHETCLKEKDLIAGVASDIWFCGESCEEVYTSLHSRVGLMNPISDGFSWTLLKCIHGDQKVHSAQRFVALKAECNIKLAVALTIMEECFLPMVDARTGIDMIPHVLYNWGSDFARLNYHGFYTMVLEKNDVLLSVASIRIHGTTLAEMPLIATCSKYRRQGMCRHLMNAIEEMLRSIKVEKLVISAIPSLVETWTLGFGFEMLGDDERRGLSTISLMVFPGTVWLKKSLLTNHLAVEQRVGTDSIAKSGGSPDVGHTVEPTQKAERNFCTEVLNGGTEVQHDENFCAGVPNGCTEVGPDGTLSAEVLSGATEVQPDQNQCFGLLNGSTEVGPDGILCIEVLGDSTETVPSGSLCIEVLNRNLSTQELDGCTKVGGNGVDDIQVEKDDLGHQFLQLSCEETVARSGENQMGVASDAKAMEVYNDGQPPLVDQQVECNLLQRNVE